MENPLPDKLNPVVKPLMDSIRKEENELFQRKSSENLCHLMQLVLQRSPSPIPKIVQNLVNFLCSEADKPLSVNEQEGILSLSTLGTEPNGSGAAIQVNTKKLTKAEELADAESKKAGRVQRRGAAFALTRIVRYFGSNVPTDVSRLWDLTFGTLEKSSVLDGSLYYL